MTLSTPIKVIALSGLAVVLAAGAMLMLVARKHHPGTSTSAPPATPTLKIVQPAAHKAPPKPKMHLDPNLPAAVRHGLLHSRKVVAFVYTGNSQLDRALLQQVRDGARSARVGFVALDVRRESVAAQVFAWSSSAADPVMFVVRRPGDIVFTLAGPTDATTVQQAAIAAR